MKFPGEQIKQLFTQNYIGYVGLTGLVCLILSGVAWIVQTRFGTISVVLSVLGLICLLVYLVVDFKNIQAQFSKRSVKYGANVAFMILIVFGIVILIEAISSRHSFLLDLTRNQRFTLSDQTQKVLKALEKDVNVIAFFSLEQGNREALEDLLKRYANVSSRIKYEFVDPDKNPGRARSYEIKSYGTVVLETAEKQEKTLESSEEALTNALVKVTRKGKKVVYFLKGHGEHDLGNTEKTGYSLVKKAIEDENYEVKDLLLMQQQSVPEDASALILGGPQKDLVPAELDSLKAYIQRGGNVLFMLDPDQAPGMTSFLKEYGIILGDNLIIDTFSRIFGAGYDMPVASAYQNHPITENFNVATFFPVARSVQVEDPLPEGVTGQTLASSSPQSWAETNKKELQRGSAEFNNESDLQGPVPLAAVVTIDVTTKNSAEKSNGEKDNDRKQKKARLVVFGDSDFASNAYMGLSGNTDLFLNTVSWLAEEEGLIAIRAKNPEISPLLLTAFQGRFAFILSLILLPLVVVITGVMVYVNRRKATR
jgi:ABC-type uncharacterized transport system involved in gliding motility auxiliary subunit